MKTTQPRVSRRRFLIGATAGTAATAAAIVASKKESAEAPTGERAAQSKKGYQLTEHVQNYYRTAKI